MALQRFLNRKDKVDGQAALADITRGAGGKCGGNKVSIFMNG